MTRSDALELGLVAASLATALVVGLLIAELGVEEEGPDGAGPVLLEALDAGWRPGPAPQAHACASCPSCCQRCNVKDQCCCWHADKCYCVKDPTSERWRGPAEEPR